MVENFEQKIVGTAKNYGKCDTNLVTDYTNDGKCDTKLMTDYNMTFGRLKPLKRGEVHCKKLAAVPESKSGVLDKIIYRTTRTPSSISKKRNSSSISKSKCSFGAKKNFFQSIIDSGKRNSCGVNPFEPNFNPFVKAQAAVPGHVTASDQPEARKETNQ